MNQYTSAAQAREAIVAGVRADGARRRGRVVGRVVMKVVTLAVSCAVLAATLQLLVAAASRAWPAVPAIGYVDAFLLVLATVGVSAGVVAVLAALTYKTSKGSKR